MADLREVQGTRAPGPNSFNFMQFLGEFGKIVCWCPPWKVGAHPPQGKPKSATASTYIETGDKSVCEELLDAIHVEPHAKVQCLLDKTKETSIETFKAEDLHSLNLTRGCHKHTALAIMPILALGIEPRPLIASDSKSNTFLSTLT